MANYEPVGVLCEKQGCRKSGGYHSHKKDNGNANQLWTTGNATLTTFPTTHRGLKGQRTY